MSSLVFPNSLIDTLKPYFVARERTEYSRLCDIYDVSNYDLYTDRGIYRIRIIYDDVYENDNLEIVAVQSSDDAGYNHGTWYNFVHEFGVVYRSRTVWTHGDLHNERGWSRMDDDFGDITKKYYLNNKLVSREVLEVNQRAAIVELLPQPIWEEVLDHYAIEV